ncbi:PhnA protein [Flavobacterium salilacus subsp. salilacus]|uniref:PhnA domain-containing protein n=1 Tax=Flavobacterium TaxID=237 RepID=UPI001074B88B|nr:MULTISPECIES: alkylphosphonate utilization protein [Flavobacterium]KAF2518398.1 PhnA protein [Flavobacterium salilacus subsp. salilacus]MBE1615032.1 PhnA domain-containing protein [Flavobacterium sp. SaA2.13]
MKLEETLKERSGNICELSGETDNLVIYDVPPTKNGADTSILITEKCLNQIDKKEELDSRFWESFLPTAMWSEVPAVQVVSWRMLNRFRNESWAADALEMMYLDEDNLAWAEATGDHLGDGNVELHKDTNGNILQNGDTVTLIKDLDVKGSTINAKIGTAVRNIRLVHDNVEQIEGKIDGQQIVILTKFVKRQ